MVTEDYISFETAKLLKEKGFKELTYACFTIDGDDLYGYRAVGSDIMRPTLQMTMKWLREVHNLHIIVKCGHGNRLVYFSNIKNTLTNDSLPNDTGYYNTYEEACEATIKYCLENLI